MRRFSDFADEDVLDGDKIKIADVLNNEITVVNYAIRDSRYSKNKSGKYLILQIEQESERHVIFTGSDVLIEQIEKYGNKIPFKATIRKVKRYYTFT
jgi:hypothetical protein